MADIELIIKIDEEDFERCKKKFKMRIGIMSDAIANGTPLPKGHGRLIDADALKNEWKKGFYKKIVDALMDDAPTVIEEDKESEDK